MSQSPRLGAEEGAPSSAASPAAAGLAEYEAGWVALHRFLREGGSFSGRERHCAFANLGAGDFADVSAPSGLDLLSDGRAVARVDWDLDGDLDLVFSSRQAPLVRVLRNDQDSGNAWISLRLVGAREPDAIGARVTVVRSDSRELTRTLRAGEGYLAQSSKWLHFGLGPDAGPAVDALVAWPGGTAQRFTGLDAGRRWVLREGGEAVPARAQPGPDTSPLARGAPAGGTSAEGEADALRERVVLGARPPLPGLPVVDVAGQDATAALAQATDGRPHLLVVWAAWCAPCVTELGELTRRADELTSAGLITVAVGADEPEDRGEALDLLSKLGWPHAFVFAQDDALETLDALQQATVDRRRRLPLPSSFLIDAEGRLAAIYRGPLEVERVLADAARLRGDADEIRAAAVPFPGRWHRPPPSVDLGYYVGYLAERGLDAAARELTMAGFETRSKSRAEILVEMGAVRAGQGELERAVQSFREAAQLQPELFEAWYYLGSALHQGGDPANGALAYERALVLDPRHGPTRFNLALARAALGQPEAAARELELLRLYQPELALELEAQLESLDGR